MEKGKKMNNSVKTVKTIALAALAALGFNDAEAATAAQLNAVKTAFQAPSKSTVVEAADGSILVTLRRGYDINTTVSLYDNLGPITLDMNGEDIEGTDGDRTSGVDGLPGIHIRATGGATDATVLTIVNNGRDDGDVDGGEGRDGKTGGNGGPGILVEGIGSVVIGSGVVVEGGEGGDGTGGRGGNGGTGVIGSYTTNGGVVRGGEGGESRYGYGSRGAVSSSGSGSTSTSGSGSAASATGGTSTAGSGGGTTVAGGSSSSSGAAASATTTSAGVSAVAAAFGSAASVSAQGSAIVATLTRDINRTITLTDDLGAVTLDMNGRDIDGTDGLDSISGKGGDGQAAIVIKASGAASNPTVLTIVSHGRRGEIEGGEGGDGRTGGVGGAGIVAGGVSSVVVGANVLVEGGEGGDSYTGVGATGGTGIVGNVASSHGIVRGGEGGNVDDDIPVSRWGSRGAATSGSSSSSGSASSGGTSSGSASSGGTYSGSASSGIVVANGFTKAVTLPGVVCDEDGTAVEGVVQVKVGKANRRGEVRVSAKATLVDGKTVSASSVKVTADETGYASGTFEFKKELGTIPFELFVEDGVCTFSGSGDDASIESAEIGGAWSGDAEFFVDVDDEDAIPGEFLSEYLPDGETVQSSGGKWVCGKAATLKYRHGEISGDDDPSRPNVSGLKLTYSASKGTFKGSFKVYTLLNGKLKKYTAKVAGVVVDGEGVGEATIKSLGVTWPVTVQR